MRVNRVSPTQPVTHGYYRQPEQPQTKVIDARAKVEEYQPDALDWFDTLAKYFNPACKVIIALAAVYVLALLAQLARWLLS